MATLSVSADNVVCISDSSFIAINIRQCDIPAYREKRSKPGSAALATVEESNLASEETKGAHEPTKVQSGADTDSDPSHLPTGRILAGCFSPRGQFFALCDDFKTLSLYDANGWHKLSTRTTPKRCISLAFNHAEDTLYAADKFGDVYQFSVSDPGNEGQLILGHLSMLLDVAVSPDDRYILTADRDEKVRISQLPNAYNIHTYCLGHREFVSRIAIIPGFDNLLITGGGDSTFRLWDYRLGRQLRCLPLCPQRDGEEEEKEEEEGKEEREGGLRHIVSGITCCQKHGLVAITTLGSQYVQLYRIMSSDSDGVNVSTFPPLDVGAVCWSACFDHSDRLWVLRQHQPRPLAVFGFRGPADKMALQPLEGPGEESEAAHVLGLINSDWSIFEGAAELPSPYANLFKRTFDNARAYLERKEQRIREQKLRKKTKKKTSKGGSPPQGKKAKLATGGTTAGSQS